MADPANECFALRREDGSLTGEIKPRALVHRDGDLHGASHVFLARLRGGRAELLLQKRSAQKDSFPGLYDISAAGHLDPGDHLLYCSGCGPDIGDGHNIVGKVGGDLTLEQGQKAAYNCMLNLLANLDAKLGDLNRIKRCVKVLGFVNCTDDFAQQPQVINGGSNLLFELFGEEKGLPARTAMGTNSCPGNIAVEIEMLVEYE